MDQQAVVARTGLDEEREVNKRALNTVILNTSRNERLDTNGLNFVVNRPRYGCLLLPTTA
jgi:hypothetical protein